MFLMALYYQVKCYTKVKKKNSKGIEFVWKKNHCYKVTIETFSPQNLENRHCGGLCEYKNRLTGFHFCYTASKCVIN